MIGRTLSHYKILSEISRGGMGIVYRAVDVKLDREVALKVLPPELVADSERKRRFVQEAKAAAKLEHPHIGVVYEIDEVDGTTFIAMELVRGEQLNDIANKARLPLTRALELAAEVAEGLAHAHDKGIVHRDLKPANILVTEDGHAKIIDFGLAKLVEPRTGDDSDLETLTREETEPGKVMGTVSYMSPEQARGQKVDKRSDIFSLGIVLYEMLAGKQPFKAPSTPEVLNAIINKPAPPLKQFTQEMSPGLQSVVDRCLAKDPQERYQQLADFLQDLHEEMRRRQFDQGRIANDVKALIRKPKVIAASGVLLLLFGLLAFWVFRHSERERWARDVALEEVRRFIEDDNYVAAFALAREVERHLANDPALLLLWPRMSRRLSITTTPSDADIFFKAYSESESEEEYLGRSPIDETRIPLGSFWLKAEKDGYESNDRLYYGLGAYQSPEVVGSMKLALEMKGDIPLGMVRIPASSRVAIRLYGFGDERLPVPTYLIDKHEVTNLEFKEFVDSGGYQNPEYWEHEIEKEGRVLAWTDAMKEFRDRTGRPGPSTWEGGTYSEGQGEWPVSGVSWYEAAACAKFLGKSLPTIRHWVRAAGLGLAAYTIPLSNFGGQGPVPVGSGPVGANGTHDMAGNVKEWCWNGSGSLRYILGGGWNEPSYMFTAADAKPPLDRSTTHGFRCIKYADHEDEAFTALMHQVEFPARGKLDYEHVSDELFSAYISQYSYDPMPLEVVIESADESSQHWRRETITFNAAYGNERIIAHLFLPKGVDPPYQTVVYFPGGNALRQRSSDSLQLRVVDFVIMSGRALMYPIYESTYERSEGLEFPTANSTRSYAEYVIRWMNDLRRSVDYLGTRDDINNGKLAYYGFSWGGRLGPIALALDKRIQVGILVAGGFPHIRPRPEVDESNFAPRVKTPVLMLNGSSDVFFPFETSQKPMFDLLGTPEEHKAHIIYKGGHLVLTHWRSQATKEILNWLDRYLGPVE